MGAAALLIINLALVYGASARLSRLLMTDDITSPARVRLIRRFGANGWLPRALRCPWCAGLWASMIVAGGWWLAGASWWHAAAAALAVNYIYARWGHDGG